MRNKTGRAKPVTPKAGVTKTSRRYTYIAKLDASEKSAMQDKINALQTQLTTEHQSGVIAQQIAAAVNPIAQAVNEIKCAQPQTVTVPYQPFQAVPNCIAYQYGMYNGCNNLNGFWL